MGKQGTFCAKGKFVGKVDYVSGSRKPLATDLFDNIKTTSRYTSGQDILRAASVNCLLPGTYPPGGTLLDAFIALLAGGACKEIHGGDEHPTLQESKKAFLAAVWSGGDIALVSSHKV